MKAITLHQPHASWLFLELPDYGYAKEYETRSKAWNEGQLIGKYRGPVAIHASGKNLDKKTQDWIKWDAEKMGIPEMEYPLGAVLGTAILKAVYVMTPEFISCQTKLELFTGLWQYGRLAIELEDRKLLDSPISALGRQGFWNWEAPQEIVDLYPEYDVNRKRINQLSLFTS